MSKYIYILRTFLQIYVFDRLSESVSPVATDIEKSAVFKWVLLWAMLLLRLLARLHKHLRSWLFNRSRESLSTQPDTSDRRKRWDQQDTSFFFGNFLSKYIYLYMFVGCFYRYLYLIGSKTICLQSQLMS